MLSNRLKQCRTARGLSKQRLARLVGVCPSTYSSYERGAYYPGDANRVRLCEILGTAERALWPEGGPCRAPAGPVPYDWREHYPTGESLRRQAGIRLGERMARRSAGSAGSSRTEGTVTEAGPWFFTVRWETGVRECFGYPAFLQDRDVRRVGA